jgi:endonuclease-3
LRALYPEAHCELDFKTPLELIVATILSAQCTDKRVNVVTKTLFARYKTAKDYAEADPAELESIVKSTGFYRAKAKSIREMAAAVVKNFGGKVPQTMEELLTLRGVARKTANVVLGTAYGKAEGVVVDTHMKRLSYRLGLTDEEDPVKVEKDLMACVPKKDWIYWGHAVIWLGRRVCKAAAPACPECPMRGFCPKRGV